MRYLFPHGDGMVAAISQASGNGSIIDRRMILLGCLEASCRQRVRSLRGNSADSLTNAANGPKSQRTLPSSGVVEEGGLHVMHY